MGNTKRLKYIDGMKGFAILFVVFYHLIWVSVKDRDSSLIPLFSSLCMQLFFFISGYVSYRGLLKMVTGKDVFENILRKARFLLVPSILMFIFFVWYYKQNYVDSILYEFKSGYWFTYVLFFIFLLHYMMVALMRKFKGGEGIRTILIWIILSILAYRFNAFPYRIWEGFRVLSLSFILKYYVFFMLGYLFYKYEESSQRIMNHEIVRCGILLLSLIPVVHPIENQLFIFFVSLSQIAIVFNLFQTWEGKSGDSWVLNQLALLGKHSMGIYFIHYYFIFGLPGLHEFIASQDTLSVVRGPGCKSIIEILCLFPIAIALAYWSICIRKLFDYSPRISELFFGSIPK